MISSFARTISKAFLSLPSTLTAAQGSIILASLMESLWAYPWLIWLSNWENLGWKQTPISLVSASALSIVVALGTFLCLQTRWPIWRIRLVILTFSILSLLLLIRLENNYGHVLWDNSWWQSSLPNLSVMIGALIFGTLLIWRAISIGTEGTTFDSIYRRFIFGLATTVTLIILWVITPEITGTQKVLPTLGLYIAGYFAVSLLAFALNNVQFIWQQLLHHNEAKGLFDRRWFTLILGIVIAIVIFSLGISSLISLDLGALLIETLGAIISWILIAILYAIGYPLAVIATGIMYAVIFLMRITGVSKFSDGVSFTLPDYSGMAETITRNPEVDNPSNEIITILKWGLLLLSVVVVLVILARAFSRKGRTDADEVEEVSESLWSWALFKSDLHSFMTHILNRFKRKLPTIQHPQIQPKAMCNYENHQQLLTVKEIYQGLIWSGNNLGFPRKASETPYEYQEKLANHLRKQRSEIRTITKAYVEEHYGDLNPNQKQLSLLNQRWHTLRSSFFHPTQPP